MTYWSWCSNYDNWCLRFLCVSSWLSAPLRFRSLNFRPPNYSFGHHSTWLSLLLCRSCCLPSAHPFSDWPFVYRHTYDRHRCRSLDYSIFRSYDPAHALEDGTAPSHPCLPWDPQLKRWFCQLFCRLFGYWKGRESHFGMSHFWAGYRHGFGCSTRWTQCSGHQVVGMLDGMGDLRRLLSLRDALSAPWILEASSFEGRKWTLSGWAQALAHRKYQYARLSHR